MVYGHLAYGDFATWPAPERAAVRDFAAAHWQASITADVHLCEFEPVLTGIMLIEDDLWPYLRHWEYSGDPVALANLAGYAREIAAIRAGTRPWNAYLAVEEPEGLYGPPRPGPGQVVEWLAGPGLAARLAARRGTLPGRAEDALAAAIGAVTGLR
ncbi:hypothetical protein Daura_18530 [Dactylosporangium aurantiacum]|uniref:Uncharacterized protein n=1 Tax=Dactylosporangium aurantiacum TaxID=35754 RepID=A0A9Q9MKH3_9ACTN|nr:hypothetical protein [Dactylosporangium aurantiacum]MDG6105832.1 hypothetical protein [Dactylosporangium aurantiacum]UWZ57985.1 hypothetical protein Daura_18530 [Dactylosporangium aurantiacum]